MFDLGPGRIEDNWGPIGGRGEAEARVLGFNGPRDDALVATVVQAGRPTRQPGPLAMQRAFLFDASSPLSSC